MILVNVRRQGDEIMELDVSGHAGQAPRGEDLVCAGASSIMVGALNAINQLADGSCALLMDEAHIKITQLKENERAKLLLASTLISLQTLESSYSRYIKIQIQEV